MKIVRPLMAMGASALLIGCAGTQTIRVSQDTAIVQARAAPACGSTGAARVAQRQAAIETIKAGFDRYVVVDVASMSDVRASQMPGTYRTTGMVSGGFVNATTTYQPGATIVTGGHMSSFAIRMFKDGDPNGAMALSAREILGPKWPELIKSGSLTTCT